MPAHTIATVRRRLGARLKSLREAAGFSVDRVAERLDWPTGRIRQAERGIATLEVDDLRELIGLYEAPADVMHDLLEQLGEAARTGWERYRSVLTREYIDYLTLEEVSSVMRQYNMCLIPGLLQTERYMRQVYLHFVDDAGPDGDLVRPADETIELLVRARQHRQELLRSARRPELDLVIDEAALLRPVGSPADMGAQFRHLQELNGTAGLTIRILPLSAGLHPGLRGSFNLLEFAEANHGWVLFFENLGGDDIEQDHRGETAARYLTMFDRLEALSLVGADVHDRLDQLIAGRR